MERGTRGEHFYRLFDPLCSVYHRLAHTNQYFNPNKQQFTSMETLYTDYAGSPHFSSNFLMLFLHASTLL